MGMWYGWVLIIAIIVAVVYFITNTNKYNDSRYTIYSETSLENLKKRLVLGEITTEEYNKLKNELTK